MTEDELHYPPGAEAEAPAPEAPKEEPKPEEVPAPKPDETPAPEAPKPEDKPEEKQPDPKSDEPPAPIKKRSIYDDLKDTRKEKNAFKDAAIAALEAQGIKLTGQETAEELQALAKSTPSPKPDEKPAAPAPSEQKPADELEAFAKENDIDPTSLARLAEIIAKKIPKAELSEEDKAGLADLTKWRAEQARRAEDDAIRAEAPAVKTQLDIHDDKELDAVMKEVVRLAHTPKFHDKEVGYIIWANKDALSKLVSPKKPSFEAGGNAPDPAPEPAIDFSSPKVTPEQVQKNIEHPKPTYEVRKAQ